MGDVTVQMAEAARRTLNSEVPRNQRITLMPAPKSWGEMSPHERADWDSMIFGAGFVHVAKDGTETHIPIEEIRVLKAKERE